MPICSQCTTEFLITTLDRKFYEKMKVPEPKICPGCREQRRLAFRNEKNLHLRTCTGCKKKIVSIYSADKPYHVYCSTCWWSDAWDPVDVGRDFDFSRTFFEQFDELLHDSKLISLFGRNNQNSDYVNQETDDKNCYLNAGGHYNEDCYYNTYCIWGKNCVDNYWLLHSELCYECINSDHCYASTFLQDCSRCSDCHYCRDCQDCKNCFGSFGLRKKKYYFFNKELKKEEYEQEVNFYLQNYTGRKKAQAEAQQHFLKYPHRAVKNIRCERSNGDLLIGCKNVQEGYLWENSEDCKYVYIGLDTKNGYDLTSFGWRLAFGVWRRVLSIRTSDI